MELSPSKTNRFFLYDPLGDGFIYFSTAQKRDAWAKDVIPTYYDDTWVDEVDDIVAGEITHTAQQINYVERPPDDQLDEDGLDEEGDDWPPEFLYKCNYDLKPITWPIKIGS